MKTRRSSNLYSKKYGNFFVLYELNSWPQDLNTDFALGGCLFGGKMLIQINPQYSINFGRPGTRFCFSLHCNGNNSFLFVNATKIHKFKTKGSQIKKYIICLGNISGDFSANNMKKKKQDEMGMCTIFLLVIELLVLVILSISINIWRKNMFGIIKKMFIVLLSSIVNASSHTQCILLSNQKCMIQPTPLINLHPRIHPRIKQRISLLSIFG